MAKITVIGAGSFSEMLSRYEIVSQIMEYDRQTAQKLQEARETVAAAKLSLETDKADEEQLKASLETNKKDMDAKIKESEAYAAQLEKDEATAERERRLFWNRCCSTLTSSQRPNRWKAAKR